MKNKRGFVLAETIVVITVLCVILIVLYASYNSLLINVKKKSNYDNTEYLYKTSVIRKYLEPRVNISTLFGDKTYGVYCSNTLEAYDDCSSIVDGGDLFKFLKVNAIYITQWDANLAGIANYMELEATTQGYIKYLDAEAMPNVVYRIIVMFEADNDQYEYGSLRFGSRG